MVHAEEGINGKESANIVGYQKITLQPGFSLFTVTFKDVSGKDYDIQNIIPCQGGAKVTTANKVLLQKCDSTGTYLSSLTWIPARGGWCKGATLCTDVNFKDGEGVCINNKFTDPIEIEVSGEVELNPWSCELGAGFNLVGNMTPVEIDIQDMVPFQDNVQVTTANKVLIQKCGSDGTYESSLTWIPARGGWCKGATLCTDVTFKPGEAGCLNNKFDKPIVLKFKSPITE